MPEGDDGSFMAAPDDEGLELSLECGSGAARGMGKLTEQAADIEIALADVPRFALARRLIVARAHADPGGQAIRASEDVHVGADLHEQHGGADEIHPRQGLQQGQDIALAFQSAQKTGIEPGDAGFDLPDVMHQFIEDEAVAFRKIPLQGLEDVLPGGLQARGGQSDHLVGRFVRR